MNLSRSEQLSDAQLTEALTVESESYSLDEWDDFPAGVNIFHPKYRERNLKEIVTALEESSLSTYTHPRLELGEDEAGNPVYFVKLQDYKNGGYSVAPLTLPLLPDDPRFEGWPGVLLVTRLLMDIIDSVPSTIPTPDKEGVASTLLP